MNQQKNEAYNPFDPTGVFKEMRDSNMDAWAKMMVDLVHTDAYASATGTMLDAWLTSSGPFRKVIENTVTQTLTSLNLPVRDDITRLAERLTNIEMRLDDLEATLREGSDRPRNAKKNKSDKSNGGGKTK